MLPFSSLNILNLFNSSFDSHSCHYLCFAYDLYLSDFHSFSFFLWIESIYGCSGFAEKIFFYHQILSIYFLQTLNVYEFSDNFLEPLLFVLIYFFQNIFQALSLLKLYFSYLSQQYLYHNHFLLFNLQCSFCLREAMADFFITKQIFWYKNSSLWVLVE